MSIIKQKLGMNVDNIYIVSYNDDAKAPRESAVLHFYLSAGGAKLWRSSGGGADEGI